MLSWMCSPTTTQRVDAQDIAQDRGRKSTAIILTHDARTQPWREVVEARLALEEAALARLWPHDPRHLAGYRHTAKATRSRPLGSGGRQRKHGVWIKLTVAHIRRPFSERDQRTPLDRSIDVDAVGSKRPQHVFDTLRISDVQALLSPSNAGAEEGHEGVDAFGRR